MPDEETNEKDQQPTIKRVNFDFIKSNAFRVIHVDGAWGGITANLNVQMAVFSERSPIPKRMTLKVTDGAPPEEVLEEREMRDAIVREVEASLVMDFTTAIAIHKWLGDKIKELDGVFKKQMEQMEQIKQTEQIKEIK